MIPGIAIPMPGYLDSAIEAVLGASSDAVGLDFPSLFTTQDWAADTKKRIILPAGVTRGITDPTKYLFRTGTGRGGELELIIDGTLEGAGAAASSAAGNTGGGVLNVQQSGVKLLGSGAMKAGGGGGGKGGNGTTTVTEGPIWQHPSYGHSVYYFWNHSSWDGGSSSGAVWGNTSITLSPGQNSIVIGGITYWKVDPVQSSQSESGSSYVTLSYRIARSYAQTTAGGNGGRGRGHDGANTNGLAGGTNAGAGGNGGDWGANGTSGANGNAGSGLAGGLAGIAINGAANLTDLFSGSKLGRII